MKKIIFIALLFCITCVGVYANGQSEGSVYSRGMNYLKNGDYDMAITEFTTLIDMHSPTYYPAVYLDRGLAFLRKGNDDRAIIDFTNYINNRPSTHHYSPLYHRGVAYSNKGNYDQAIEDFSTVLRLFPNSSSNDETRSALADAQRARAAQGGTISTPPVVTQAQQQIQQLQNGISVIGRLPRTDSEVWYSVTPTESGFIAITLQGDGGVHRSYFLEIYDTNNNLLTTKRGVDFDIIMPTETSKTYMIRLIYTGFYNNAGHRITAAIEAFDPNPPPNSGNDFDITQNVQGGITITGYRGTRRQIVIPATISGIRVTEIGQNVFNEKGLISVVIPNSVTTIGSSAFNNANLTSVTIPNSVAIIGSNAFSNNNLTSVTIPNSVTTIGSNAFNNNNLTSVTFPNSIININSNAFSNNNLTTVTIPNSVTTIGYEAFNNNNLTSVTFGNRIETIGTGAFANNKLTELTNLPASITIIGVGAFYNNSITTVVLPSNSNLALISGSILSGEYFNKPAFANNPITTLVIPAGLAQTRTRSVDSVGSSNIGSALGNSIRTLTTITMPANAPMGNSNLISGFINNFSVYYESQNRRAGTYNWDGRLWSVR